MRERPTPAWMESNGVIKFGRRNPIAAESSTWSSFFVYFGSSSVIFFLFEHAVAILKLLKLTHECAQSKKR